MSIFIAGAVLRIDELMMSYKESQVTVMTKLIKMAFNNPIHKVCHIILMGMN